MYYYFQRWYDPTVGRFISPDSRLGRLSIPQTQNRYVYVANNPLEYSDPSGEFLNIVTGAVAGAVIDYGTCVWATGGWTSTKCGIAAGAGAIAGAIAGATFNPALRLAVDVGLTGGSLGAFVLAGAISGAIAGGVSYAAQGGLTMPPGQKFDWSVQNLALSVGFGALTGAAFAGAGYGIARFAPDILGFEGEQLESGQNPAGFWSKGTFYSAQDSVDYHIDVHGLGRTPSEYTQEALGVRNAKWSEGGPWPIGKGPRGCLEVLGGRSGGIRAVSTL